MDRVSTRLTVFFEEPFWVGVFECVDGDRLRASKVTFGSEPKDYEVRDFIAKNYFLLNFSPAVETVCREQNKNPKRMQREAKKQLLETGIGTRSQQALKLQQEQNKQERKIRTRAQREADERRSYELRQQKKKEKHRGR